MIILLVVVIAINLSDEKDKDKQKSTLQTSGSASLMVMPDQAEIYISVQTIASTAKEAQTKNANIANDVLAALRKKVGDEKNMQTTNYYVSEEKEYDPSTQQFQSKGYRALHQFRIITKDIALAGSILDDAVSAGATNIDSVSFTLSEQKQKEVRKELISKASVDAKTKAKMLAASLDMELEDPLFISESGYEPPFYYGNYDAKASLMEPIATSIQPGEVKVSTTVMVTFEIE